MFTSTNLNPICEDSAGERVSVLQQRFGDSNQLEQAILPYPQDAQQLADFSPDLAVYVSGPIDGQTQNSANQIDIYHKNSDNTITELQVAGTVSEQTLETIAKAYLQTPRK